MHDEGVELELTDADEALYQLRLVSQVSSEPQQQKAFHSTSAQGPRLGYA